VGGGLLGRAGRGEHQGLDEPVPVDQELRSSAVRVGVTTDGEVVTAEELRVAHPDQEAEQGDESEPGREPTRRQDPHHVTLSSGQ
jgi:hypothetical protein